LKLNYGIAPLSSNLKQGFSLGGRNQSICTNLGFHHLYTKLLLDFFFWAVLLQDPKLQNNWDLDVVNAEEGEEDSVVFSDAKHDANLWKTSTTVFIGKRKKLKT
jgi:hypothetical protein